MFFMFFLDFFDLEFDCFVFDNDDNVVNFLRSMFFCGFFGGFFGNGFGGYRLEEEDEFVKDFWNVVVVVGLRVYY